MGRNRPVAPAMQQQRPVAYVGNQQRFRRGGIQLDTATNPVSPTSLVGTATHVVGTLACLVGLVMHVPYARL